MRLQNLKKTKKDQLLKKPYFRSELDERVTRLHIHLDKKPLIIKISRLLLKFPLLSSNKIHERIGIYVYFLHILINKIFRFRNQ